MKTKIFIASVLIALCLWALVSYGGDPAAVEATSKNPSTDTYHGVEVTEYYRWLENASDPAVRRWSDSQNRATRSYLDNLPARPAIAERLTELYGNVSANYYSLQYHGDLIFALKYQPPTEQPYLVAFKAPDSLASERVIVDPNELDSGGGISIDFFAPSRDGKLVAVSLSEGGSEKGTVSVFRVDGAKLDDAVPRVNNPTAGGSVAWNTDGSGFYYTRYPHEGERPEADLDFFQQVYFHKLGTPASEDRYAIGEEFPRIAEIELQTSGDGRYILATVSNGDGGEYAHYLLGPSSDWTQVTKFSDRITKAVTGPNRALYMLSYLDAPRGKILRLSLEEPSLEKARVVVGESDAVIKLFEPTNKLLYVADLADGSSQIRVFDFEGNARMMVPVKPLSSVWQILTTEGDRVIFHSETYTEPDAWYAFDPETGEVTQTALAVKSPVDFSDVEVSRAFATSKDGTRVPMTIIAPKGITLDGTSPALLTGYGGYGISRMPSYNVSLRLWLDQGAVYAVANIRGGGEYGEDWHLAGNLTKKQNVFDDFIACAEYLVDKGYTSSERLAIEGGSNGGLLMGAAMTQRPELFRAVVAHSGLYDMLRSELEPNGAFNVTEFGTVKDPEQFKALYAYSPYHRVEDSKAYPSAIFLTGDNDGRVDPANSRKMVARLQEATSSNLPILLRTSSSVGHGIGSGLSEIIAARADVYAFLLDQLRIKYRQPGEKPQ